MSSYVEQNGSQELAWDLQRIYRNPLNIEVAAVAGGSLASTAVLPACYVLGFQAGANAYPLRWTFASDTAIGWDLYITFGNPNFTAYTDWTIGNGSSPNWGFQGEVIAAPSIHTPVTGGFCPANGFIDVLSEYRFLLVANQSLALVTSAIAANVKSYCLWTEYIN